MNPLHLLQSVTIRMSPLRSWITDVTEKRWQTSYTPCWCVTVLEIDAHHSTCLFIWFALSCLHSLVLPPRYFREDGCWTKLDWRQALNRMVPHLIWRPWICAHRQSFTEINVGWWYDINVCGRRMSGQNNMAGLSFFSFFFFFGIVGWSWVNWVQKGTDPVRWTVTTQT